jgi:hypothetical protein
VIRDFIVEDRMNQVDQSADARPSGSAPKGSQPSATPSPGTQPEKAVRIKAGRESYDMFDDPAEVGTRWPLLKGLLDLCDQELGKDFIKADDAAESYQFPYQTMAGLAAFTGSSAVLFAIAQLAFPGKEGGEWIPRFEVLAAVLALVAVVLAVLLAFKRRWLRERHRAERLRAERYRLLIDSDVWSGDPSLFAARVDRLRQSVDVIRALDFHHLHHWLGKKGSKEPSLRLGSILTIALHWLGKKLSKEQSPDGAKETVPTTTSSTRVLPPLPPTPIPSVDAIGQLVDYYRTKRLGYQRAFFARRALDNKPIDLVTRFTGPLMFFLSVSFVLAHYILELVVHDPALADFSKILVFLAAAVPTVAGGIRTVRVAFENSRNMLRYEAYAATLQNLDETLHRDSPPADKLRDMAFCEQELMFEHQEWGRLMMETETIP